MTFVAFLPLPHRLIIGRIRWLPTFQSEAWWHSEKINIHKVKAWGWCNISNIYIYICIPNHMNLWKYRRNGVCLSLDAFFLVYPRSEFMWSRRCNSIRLEKHSCLSPRNRYWHWCGGIHRPHGSRNTGFLVGSQKMRHGQHERDILTRRSFWTYWT